MSKLSKVKHVFLDMDGTIYQGKTMYPTTQPFLDFLKSRGIGYTFLTNNSSCGMNDYAEKLTRMGLPAVPEDFYSSTNYCISYLQRKHPEIKKLFLLSVPTIRPEFEEAGFELVEDDPDAVVLAFDKTIDYEKMCRAAWFMSNDIPSFATHPDVFCPTDQPTFLVDCGAMTACLETATGKKMTVLGKPDPGMLITAAEKLGIQPDECLMCGDRLQTDIAVGTNAGTVTCYIYHPGAPESDTPDYTLNNLAELIPLWDK